MQHGDFITYTDVPKKHGKIFAGKIGMRDGVDTDFVDTEEYLRYQAESDHRCTFDAATGMLWFDPNKPDPPHDRFPNSCAVVYDGNGNSWHLTAMSPRSWLETHNV